MVSWITCRRPRLAIHLLAAVDYSIIHFWVFIWFCLLC